MPRLELVLVDWPDRPDSEGPRLLGHLRDDDLVSEAKNRLAADHVKQIRVLRPPVSAVQRDTEAPGA